MLGVLVYIFNSEKQATVRGGGGGGWGVGGVGWGGGWRVERKS